MTESAKRRTGLGRGLGALIMNTSDDENAPPEERSEASTRGATGVRQVALSAIAPNPRQPRTRFDDTALDELAASIRVHGLIQPLVLTTNTQRPDLYWLVAGERRWRAAQRAGLQSVPAIVREATPQQLVEVALIENLQRADLNPLEEAHAYATLLEEFGLTQAEVAERVGRSRSAVANTVRLLNLPAPVQSALVEESITAGHARALLALPNAAAMEETLAQIKARTLNVRQTEILVKRLLAEAETAALAQAVAAEAEVSPQEAAQVAFMEERLRSVLGTRVSLNRNANGAGRLVVHFYTDEDLEAIFQRIAGEAQDAVA
jgi:ParB family chromosome partitioning protein